MPGERVPLDGLKVALISLLADQVMLPVELGSSVRVTVHGAVTPQVLESKLVGLTDHARTTCVGVGVGVDVGVGVGLGVGVGVGVEVAVGLGEGVGDGDGEGGGVVPGGLVGEGTRLGGGVGVIPVTTSVRATVAFPAFEVILTAPE
jgi:hypothetical protein